jgi:endonuclease G
MLGVFMLLIKVVLIFILSFSVHSKECVTSDFGSQYYPRTGIKTSELYCYDQYVLEYDFSRKSATWVGEHLSPKEVFIIGRKNSFRQNNEIPKQFRTTVQDYKEPIFDQGHLAPSADMTSLSAERESFLLSNMVPQYPNHNRGIWKQLEEYLRELSRDKDIVVITGPIYEEPVSFIGNSVPVPAYLFKYIYNITDKTEVGFLIPNINSGLSNEIIDYKTDKDIIESKSKIKFN